MARLVVVGAGILGLAHAWYAHRAGHDVTVFERADPPEGASVRNFGMIWPIGQPIGQVRDLALHSRELWEEVALEAGIWFSACGSLQLAYSDAQAQVWSEFSKLYHAVPQIGQWLEPEACREKCPSIQMRGLRGGWLSQVEACVDPRTTISTLAGFLGGQGVEIRYGTPVMEVGSGTVHLADGEKWSGDHVFHCAGPFLRESLPQVVAETGLVQCRLQMIRLRPKSTKRLGIHLAAGLTQLHYGNFKDCPSLPLVQMELAARYPEQIARGIHVLVSEHSDGTITVGDSHVYGEVSAYRDETTDNLILEALDEFLDVSQYEIIERWFGDYNTHPSLPFLRHELQKGVTVMNVFGTGMTLSMAVAEQSIASL